MSPRPLAPNWTYVKVQAEDGWTYYLAEGGNEETRLSAKTMKWWAN